MNNPGIVNSWRIPSEKLAGVSAMDHIPSRNSRIDVYPTLGRLFVQSSPEWILNQVLGPR